MRGLLSSAGTRCVSYSWLSSLASEAPATRLRAVGKLPSLGKAAPCLSGGAFAQTVLLAYTSRAAGFPLRFSVLLQGLQVQESSDAALGKCRLSPLELHCRTLRTPDL